MKLAVTAFIVTIVVGYLVDCYLSYSWGWPDMGTVFAIATMGRFSCGRSSEKINPID